MTPARDSSIVIVGAGVFGLSTALHLAKRGYSNIHLCDKQPYDKNSYACSEGCDAASADENKILRASYGSRKLYQDLAFKAMPAWEGWNELLARTPVDELPPGLKPETKLWNNCGFLRLTDYGLDEDESETQANFPQDIKHTQYRVSDSKRTADALKDGIPASKVDPFGRSKRGLPTDGVLDTTAGFVLASRACAFALYLCRKAGVRLHLGPSKGQLKSLVKHGSRVKGIVTADDTRHPADLVIMAAGGWTPSLLPEAENLIETTAGSVLSIQLPEDRRDLWDKYSPEQFPVWSWRMGSYDASDSKSIGGIYGLPRTPEGILKVAFRGAKWTNYSRRSSRTGRPISYPKTDVEEVPEIALRVVRAFCRENMPDLLEVGLQRGRLCWYTDSVDNSFLIDYVPDVPHLMVASGGSGHGFKFLPVLGEHVVDVIERKDTKYTRLFQWRDVPKDDKNGLEEGLAGWRTLDKQRFAGKRQWKL